MNILQPLQRYWRLGSFWSRRVDFYRDLAVSQADRELLKNFVDGEINISLAPKTANKSRASGLIYMRDLMDSGDPSLHEVLIATMPKTDMLALTILKDSKDKAESLRTLSKNIEEQMALNKVVRQALTSPVILIPVGFSFAYLLSKLVIPEFVKAAPPEIWTGYNAAVRSSASWMTSYGGYALATFVAALAYILVVMLPNYTAQWRYRAESARGYSKALWMLICPFQPILSMYRDIQGTRMLGNLANLLQSGMLLNEALSKLAAGAQPWMRRHLEIIAEHLTQTPGDYVGAFSHGILSPFLLGRLSSMVRRDSSGEFDAVLIELGSVGQEEARLSVHKSAVQMNAVLLAATLSVIMFFYLGQSSIARSIEQANSPASIMKRNLKKQQNLTAQPPVVSSANPTAIPPR